MVTLIGLQVEVSSPSAELEKTICTNSLYGASMCSKISTSLYNNGSSGSSSGGSQSGGCVGGGVGAGCGSSNNEFGDWSDNSDKSRVASDSAMQTNQQQVTVSSKFPSVSVIISPSDSCAPF